MPTYLTVITVINFLLKHTFLIEFNVLDWSEKSRLIPLKFQQEETRNNSVEYNSLVYAYRKAYPGIPAQEATAKAKTKWAEVKDRYVMDLFFISNSIFEKYSAQMDNTICVFVAVVINELLENVDDFFFVF